MCKVVEEKKSRSLETQEGPLLAGNGASNLNLLSRENKRVSLETQLSEWGNEHSKEFRLTGGKNRESPVSLKALDGTLLALEGPPHEI